MALSKLDSLYMAVVSDHSKHPHHQGQIEDVDQIQLNNPTCGDVIQLSVKFDENDRVEDIAFVNSGCTISTASASMMTDAVMGKQKRKSKNWHWSFQKWSKANQILGKRSWEMQPSYLESQNSHSGLNVRPSPGMLLKNAIERSN